jgi:hypothetical protein
VDATCAGIQTAEHDEVFRMVRYCPAGDGAFEDWVEKCPECGRTLTAKPVTGDAVHAPDSDLVWLATAPNQPEAEMWAQTLRDAGIPVLVQSGGPGFGAWASVAMFEHHLFVHRRDLKRARDMAELLLNAHGHSNMNVPRRTAVPVVSPVRRRRSR